MNILVISHLYPTSDKPISGLFVHRQAKALSNMGHSVRVISPQPYVPALPSLWRDSSEEVSSSNEVKYGELCMSFPHYIQFPGKTTHALSALSMRFFLRAHIDCGNVLKSFCPDIINSHVPIVDGYASIAIAEQLDAPLFTTVHGASIYNSDRIFLSKFILNRVFKRSDATIFNTKNLLNECKKVADPINPHVVHNGVPIDQIDNAEPARIKKHSKHNIVIVSLGYLQERKKQRIVIEALADLPPESRPLYILIGDGPKKDKLIQLAKDLNVFSNTKFMTNVTDHSSVFSILKSSDMMVLPSVDEAFGIAYIEAMACHCPVVACRGEGPEEFINDGENGFLVNKNNKKEIIKIIEQLSSDNFDIEYMEKNARKTVEEKYTWERSAQKLTNIFNEERSKYTG